MQTNRGLARRDCRSAPARTRFTPRQRFAKAELCPSIKAFYAVRIFSRLHGGGRLRVGWVEPTGPARSGRPDDRLRETHHAARRPIDGFRKGSTHPTRYLLGTFASHFIASRASKPIASAHSISSTTSTNFCPVST